MKSKIQINFNSVKNNWGISILAILLSIIGLINLYSATQSSLLKSSQHFFHYQLIYVLVGIVVMLVLSYSDYRQLEHISYHAYIINIVLLLLVLFIGKKVYGSRRWLNLGLFNMQVSEFMKLTLVFALSRFISRNERTDKYNLITLLKPVFITLIPFILIVLEPDLGTGLILFFITFSIVLLIGIQKRTLIVLFSVISISLPVAYNYLLKDYQKKRVMTFLDPSKDPRGTGYNTLQSKIAVGSGRLLGKGFKKGTQTHLNFLPEHHTDFVFSVFAEEHGFLKSSVVIILFIILFFLGINISQKSKDEYGRLVAIGLTAMIFWHFFINVGMVLGIMPIVGVALPFFSYGGSAIITTFASIGVLQSIYRRRFMF